MSLYSYANGAVTSTKATLVTNTTTGPINMAYYNIGNPNSTLAYLQFFDALAANVTVGTTPPLMTVAVPAFGGVVDTWPMESVQFKTGIVIAATTTPTGSTNPTSALTLQIFTK